MMCFWLDPEAFPGTTTATPPVQNPKNILLCNKSFFENKQNIFFSTLFFTVKNFLSGQTGVKSDGEKKSSLHFRNSGFWSVVVSFVL